MSLMKLLSVSHSFVGGRNQSGRYKMAEQSLLPKFAPVGRPISLAPIRDPAVAPAQHKSDKTESATSAPGFASANPMPAVEYPPGKTPSFVGPMARTIAAVTPQPSAAVCLNAVPASTNWFRFGKNPFTHLRTERTGPQTPVQTELSLDAVRPVRNDLSDADLEVVPVKPAMEPPGKQKPARARWFKPELTGLAWSRLTARLFNSQRLRA